MIAESLRRDLASAILERDVAQREVAELRESIAQEIDGMLDVALAKGWAPAAFRAFEIAAAIARGQR